MISDLPGQQVQRQANETTEVVLATIPQHKQDTVLEIVMLPGADGTSSIELRSLTWGNGVGWYRQHTIQLDGATARHMIQALEVVQRRVEHQGQDSLVRRILPFPRHPRQGVATA
jgi:hypothetical protein